MALRTLRTLKNPYFRYSAIYNFVSGIESTITTHSVFGALIQENNNILYNVSFNYLAKDVVSNVGSLMVIGRLSKNVDKHPLGTMYLSQFAYQAALISECYAKEFPEHFFIPILGFAGVGKAMAWTSVGAINAKVLSKIDPEKIGENYTKLAIINTTTSSLGTASGLLVVKCFPETFLVTVPLCTIIRIYYLRKMCKYVA